MSNFDIQAGEIAAHSVTRNDTALRADFTEAFKHWNTKQIFAFLTFEYTTESNVGSLSMQLYIHSLAHSLCTEVQSGCSVG